MSENAIKYRADIDGLRAVAVSAVVIYHAFPSLLPSGFIGVDIFFVISGYLISSIILSGLRAGTFSFEDFYARRIKRIFPALLLVLIGGLVSGYFLLLADEYKETGKHIAGGAAFISNFVLWSESGYFDSSAEKKLLLHLWSLGIEEQFYIVWPIVLWAAFRFRVRLLGVVLVLALASFVYNVQYIGYDKTFVFYMPYTRAWELLLGAALAYLNFHFAEGSRRGLWMTIGAQCLSVLGVLCLAYGFMNITPKTVFPGWAALAPVLGATLLIAAGPKALLNRYVLSIKPLVWIGLISYPLYLWHWPIISYLHIINSEPLSTRAGLFAIGGAILLAALTYLLVERPLRKSGFRFKTALLTLSMIVIGCCGLYIFQNNGLEDRGVIQHTVKVNQQFVGPIWKFSKNDQCTTNHPFPDASEYNWWFCSINQDKPPEILLLGSSFANHLYPGFASHDYFGRFSILSVGTCPIDMEVTSDPNAPKDTSPCSGDRAYRQKVFIDNIVAAGSIRVAILAGLNPEQTPQTIERIQARIDVLEKQNILVVMFKPHIRRDGDLKGCFARPLKQPEQDCTIALKQRNDMDESFQPLVDALQQSHKSIKFYDQNVPFCGREECSLVVRGMPVFRDQYSHYSEFASDVVTDDFKRWAAVSVPELAVRLRR
ncbi:acyltransferase family protein [Hydrogenophaga palleronii]|uniref:acyltransferase family protein n=1 Tax=Hydrogenophaga palleronii TaxID=65655 RepID=UPI0008255993|nr:acyltransferase family protein [Hydrogenophaga palleronii]